MSENKPLNDPSMDDILASIRKIISDDEARAAAPPSHAAPASGEPAKDDVLLLTDLIEEPPGMATAAKGPAEAAKVAPMAGIKPIPSPPRSPVMDIDAPQPGVAGTPAPPQPPVAVMPPLTAARPAPSAANTGGRVSASFERLNRSVVDADAPPRAPVPPASSSGFGSKTIEELMREMMHAALQEWMDKNLPEMVEKMVEREIARMARR